MLHEFALPEEFFASLFEFDEEIARQVAAAGCPQCGGPLHRADYERKPRGARFAAASEGFTLRHSLCCGRRDCRKRALPPSLRFLGRRVYVEVVVLLASVAAQVVSALRAARSVTGVPGRTLRRWGAWWRDTFPGTPTWVELRSRFVPPPPEESELPRSLVARLDAELGGSVDDVCAFAARCLAPATTSSVPGCARFVRDIDRRRVLG
jgi:hypothetical protein